MSASGGLDEMVTLVPPPTRRSPRGESVRRSAATAQGRGRNAPFALEIRTVGATLERGKKETARGSAPPRELRCEPLRVDAHRVCGDVDVADRGRAAHDDVPDRRLRLTGGRHGKAGADPDTAAVALVGTDTARDDDLAGRAHRVHGRAGICVERRRRRHDLEAAQASGCALRTRGTLRTARAGGTLCSHRAGRTLRALRSVSASRTRGANSSRNALRTPLAAPARIALPTLRGGEG